MRSSRVKMRNRPISVTAQLPLVATDMVLDDESEREELNIIVDQSSHQSFIAIPIPPINKDESYYTRYQYSPYQLPESYIKFHQSSTASLYSAYDRYDLKHEDVEWLQAINEKMSKQAMNSVIKQTISEDEFARCIDTLEKEAGVLTLRGGLLSSEEKIDPSQKYTLSKAIFSINQSIKQSGGQAENHESALALPHKLIEEIYWYWIGKRKRLGKALLRIFEEGPPKGNTDPHVAFRPRIEGRRISKRNPRKDDISAYQKMMQLQKDWTRVTELVDHLVQRETLKDQSIKLKAQIFDKELEESIQGKRLTEMLAAADAAKAVNQSTNQSSTTPPIKLSKQHTLNQAINQPSLAAYRTLSHTLLPECTYVRTEKKRTKSRQSVKPPTHPPINQTNKQKPPKPTKPVQTKKESINQSISQSMLPPSEFGYDSSFSTDSDGDWLSEQEEDIMYFHEIESFLHRSHVQRAHASINQSSSQSTKQSLHPPVNPGRVDLAFPEWSQLPNIDLVQKPPTVNQVLGQCKPRIGRSGLLWIEPVLYMNQQYWRNQASSQSANQASAAHPPMQRSATSINPSTSQSINQLSNQPTSSPFAHMVPQQLHYHSNPPARSINQSTNQSTNQPITEAVSHATSFTPYPTNPSYNQPINQSTNQPMSHDQRETPMELDELRHGIMKVPVNPAILHGHVK